MNKGDKCGVTGCISHNETQVDNCSKWAEGLIDELCGRYVAEAPRTLDSSGSNELAGSVTNEDIELVNHMMKFETKKILYALVTTLLARDDPQNWVKYIMDKFK